MSTIDGLFNTFISIYRPTYTADGLGTENITYQLVLQDIPCRLRPVTVARQLIDDSQKMLVTHRVWMLPQETVTVGGGQLLFWSAVGIGGEESDFKPDTDARVRVGNQEYTVISARAANAATETDHWILDLQRVSRDDAQIGQL